MKTMGRSEVWKDIPEYEGFYQASNLGRIRRNSDEIINISGDRCPPKLCVLKGQKNQKGYLSVSLSKSSKVKSHKVHRLVLMSFAGGRSPEIQCNHIDGVKTNNHIENLEWSTASENMKHAFRIGLQTNRGEKSSKAKLTWDGVGQIRKRLANGKTQKEVSKLFGVADQTISDIANNKTWVIPCH